MFHEAIQKIKLARFLHHGVDGIPHSTSGPLATLN